MKSPAVRALLKGLAFIAERRGRSVVPPTGAYGVDAIARRRPFAAEVD